MRLGLGAPVVTQDTDTGAAPYAVRDALAAEPEDGTLVAAVRLGDDRAFEQLFGRYQRRITAYVYGMVSDHGRAEDITQEIFISALRRMRETDRPIAFKPWIYEIAKNACIDQFRRSKRADEVSIDADEGLGAADYGRLVQRGPTPDAAVDQKQALHDLCGAFGGLSETHHQILVLRELEGLSYREIGARLGMSRPSVESTLFRARRRLGEEYDELASGQRCERVQALMGTAAEGLLGTRERRRVARHLSHCQPCRRQARLAGVDGAVMARRPGRGLGARIAGFLPFPAFLHRRRASGDGSPDVFAVHASALGTMPEPVLTGFSKGAAAAAALVLAGVGAGVGSQTGLNPFGGNEGRSASLVSQRATGTRAPAAPRATRSVAAGSVATVGADRRAAFAMPRAGAPVGTRPGTTPSSPTRRPAAEPQAPAPATAPVAPPPAPDAAIPSPPPAPQAAPPAPPAPPAVAPRPDVDPPAPRAPGPPEVGVVAPPPVTPPTPGSGLPTLGVPGLPAIEPFPTVPPGTIGAVADPTG